MSLTSFVASHRWSAIKTLIHSSMLRQTCYHMSTHTQAMSITLQVLIGTSEPSQNEP